MLTKKLKTAVIGLGRIGQIHAQNLSSIENVELAALSDIRTKVLKDTAEKFQCTNLFENYTDVLEHAELDAVVICSPTDTHAPIIEAAANKGLHIFCEKPVDLEITKVIAAVEIAKKNKVKLQIGFNRRFDPTFKKTASDFKNGLIGDPHLLKITSRDPEPPSTEYNKSCGGLFLDMTIHDFDMARFILGGEIQEVYATGSNLIEPKAPDSGNVDTAVVVLKFLSGAICTIDNSRRAVYGYDQRIEIFGSDGCLHAANTQPIVSALWNQKGIIENNPHFFFLERYEKAYVEEIKSFVSCIENDSEPAVTGDDAYQATLLAIAAKKSLAEKRPVQLNTEVNK